MAGVRVEGMDEGRGRGAQEAATWDSFCAEHRERLVGLAGLVCGEIGSAEDIVQTALERAWRSRAALRGADHLRPWLDRIVVREAARERRFRLTWLGRLLRVPVVAEIESAGADIVDPVAGGFHERVALRLAFDRLSPAQRAVVVLHLHEGHSVDETAEALGVPRDTVRSRLRSARQLLRQAYEEAG